MYSTAQETAAAQWQRWDRGIWIAERMAACSCCVGCPRRGRVSVDRRPIDFGYSAAHPPPVRTYSRCASRSTVVRWISAAQEWGVKGCGAEASVSAVSPPWFIPPARYLLVSRPQHFDCVRKLLISVGCGRYDGYGEPRNEAGRLHERFLQRQ